MKKEEKQHQAFLHWLGCLLLRREHDGRADLPDDLDLLEDAFRAGWGWGEALTEPALRVQAVVGAGIPDAPPCFRCGRRDGLDAAVDDDTWARISGRTDGGGLLCLWCMDELAAERGLENIPARLYFAGRALYSVPVDEFTDLDYMWIEQAQGSR